MSGSTSVKIGSHGVTSWHRSHWGEEGKSLRDHEANRTHNAGVAGSNPAPATTQSVSSEQIAESPNAGRRTCGSISGSTTGYGLLIRRSRVRTPAGSLSYEPSPEGVREEVREGDRVRPLGVPGVAAQVFGRAS